MNSQLTPQNRERAIDALARNNNIIKSLFPYKKHISFLVVSLAIQKIKIKAHKNALVMITKNEIQSLATGNDTKIGINNLINTIRKDLEVHNFFNLYEPNSGLKDIRQSLIHQTALTKDLFEDLTITFNSDLFTTFQSEKNYTIQSLNQLRNCNENQTTALYVLTQPYAKSKSANLKLSITHIRRYLRIADDAYRKTKTLTMRVKKIAQMVRTRTDINLSVEPIKKNTKTGTTIGYLFNAEFKDRKLKKITNAHLTKHKPINACKQPRVSEKPNTHKPINVKHKPRTDKPINIGKSKPINNQQHSSASKSINSQHPSIINHSSTNKQLSIRQQLSNWGVSKKQINLWLANLTNKTISDAITQTLRRAHRQDINSNAGGYIYSILGDGKSLESIGQIKSNKQAIYCLEKFGLSSLDIKTAQKQTKANSHVLIAVVNKCLREIEHQSIDENNVRQFFTNQLDEVLGELK